MKIKRLTYLACAGLTGAVQNIGIEGGVGQTLGVLMVLNASIAFMWAVACRERDIRGEAGLITYDMAICYIVSFWIAHRSPGSDELSSVEMLGSVATVVSVVIHVILVFSPGNMRDPKNPRQ